MLVVTRLGVFSFRPFPCSIDDKMLVNLMVEASLPIEIGRGERIFTKQGFQIQSLFCAHHMIAGRHKHLVSNYFVDGRDGGEGRGAPGQQESTTLDS